jgi:hypothetical protein
MDTGVQSIGVPLDDDEAARGALGALDDVTDGGDAAGVLARPLHVDGLAAGELFLLAVEQIEQLLHRVASSKSGI